MKLDRIHLSERTQVALILLLALGVLSAIWYFLLLPQQRLKGDIERRRRDLALAASKYANESIPGLRQAVSNEFTNVARLEQEWSQIAERLATFLNQADLRQKGRIDFKFELFNTRKRLIDKSDTLGIQLIPVDLGIDDAILSRDNDKIRERMLQLQAVEKLADLTLDRRIERLISINPLPPKPFPSSNGSICFTEYPVRVEFDISFDNLYALFQSVFEENRVFAFRAIRIAAGLRPDAPVRVHAVMSALVFE